MPRKETLARARQAAKEGKAPSTQAGEFVREEIEEIREGKHGARSTKQLPDSEVPRTSRWQQKSLPRTRAGSNRKPSSRRAKGL
jgi:hypothetical protein